MWILSNSQYNIRDTVLVALELICHLLLHVPLISLDMIESNFLILIRMILSWIIPICMIFEKRHLLVWMMLKNILSIIIKLCHGLIGVNHLLLHSTEILVRQGGTFDVSVRISVAYNLLVTVQKSCFIAL